MGTDMACFGERKTEDGWEEVEFDPPLFNYRSYGVYGFLADVRNYSKVPPIAPWRGLPKEHSPAFSEDGDSRFEARFCASWLSLEELEAFNYEAVFEDRRSTGYDGAATDPVGKGKQTTFRDFLGEAFFDELKRLKEAGADRIVFWFD